MIDRAWKYGLQILGDESVMRSADDGHLRSIVMIEYHVTILDRSASALKFC